MSDKNVLPYDFTGNEEGWEITYEGEVDMNGSGSCQYAKNIVPLLNLAHIRGYNKSTKNSLDEFRNLLPHEDKNR